MLNLLNKLKGWKTYLAMIALGLLGIFYTEGMVSDDTAKMLGTVLATLAGIAMRSGLNTSAEAANQPLIDEMARLKNLIK